MISRILIIDFNIGFFKLMIKKSKKMRYSISNELSYKLLKIAKKTFFIKIFFYNNIIDNKNNRRAEYIKKIFETLINKCFGIDDKRKKRNSKHFNLQKKTKKKIWW